MNSSKMLSSSTRTLITTSIDAHLSQDNKFILYNIKMRQPDLLLNQLNKKLFVLN